MRVAFYKARKRLFNRAVSWWLRGPYSHCELILSEDAGVCECVSASFMDGGVRVKFMSLKPEHWDIVDVPAAPGAREWFETHFADAYDLRGLLGFVWRRERGDKDKWFCSEAVAAMLGWHEPWRFDPCSLHAALTSTRPSAGFLLEKPHAPEAPRPDPRPRPSLRRPQP